MYKNIALLALLLPFSGYALTKQERINELKDVQYKKHSNCILFLWQFTKIAATYYNHIEYFDFMKFCH